MYQQKVVGNFKPVPRVAPELVQLLEWFVSSAAAAANKKLD